MEQTKCKKDVEHGEKSPTLTHRRAFSSFPGITCFPHNRKFPSCLPKLGIKPLFLEMKALFLRIKSIFVGIKVIF